MLFSRFCVPSLLILLAACASQPQRPHTVSRAAPGVKIGTPYVVMGQRYVPVDDRTYDEKGIASWYGPTFHSKPTANGEIYNQDDVTAAHKTLPMPSWVEVTNLDNGRQLVVRVNDRGPFVDGRIIDLSRRSAQLLGVDRVGLANVRVRRVYPPQDWAWSNAPASRRIAGGALATATSPAPAPAAPAPVPVSVPAAMHATPVSPSTSVSTGSFVQVAAVGDRGRAEYLARNLSGFGPSSTQAAPNGMWRIRLGPFLASQADRVLAQVRLAGYPDALLVHEP